MRMTHRPLGDAAGLGIFSLMARALAPRPRAPEERGHAHAASVEASPARPGILDRLDTWFWRTEQRALEEYLGKAQDIYDLEARIRGLERGATFPYY
jgi:hypothetical protein